MTFDSLVALFRRLGSFPSNAGGAAVRGAALTMCLAWNGGAVGAETEEVIFDRPTSAVDPRKDYPIRLMREILDRTTKEFGPYTLRYSDVPIEHRPRLLREMEEGRLVNVTIQPTLPSWEKQLLVIRLPVDKGLPSYRVFLINQDSAPAFAAVTNLDQLRTLRLGVDRNWATHALYEANRLNIVTGSTYDGLFAMLVARRFDYFPRAIYEAIPEQAARRDRFPGIVVESSLALYVPLPRYVFVSPARPRLAERIETGFERMIRDGSFDRMFMEYHADMIRQADFCKRRILRMDNPLLSKETPLGREELWFDPFRPTVVQGKKQKAVCPG